MPLFLLVFAQRERVVAAGKSACALRQHLLASFGQLIHIFLHTFLGLIKLPLLLGVLFLQAIKT